MSTQHGWHEEVELPSAEEVQQAYDEWQEEVNPTVEEEAVAESSDEASEEPSAGEESIADSTSTDVEDVTTDSTLPEEVPPEPPPDPHYAPVVQGADSYYFKGVTSIPTDPTTEYPYPPKIALFLFKGTINLTQLTNLDTLPDLEPKQLYKLVIQ